jgi:hypothetical protein
VAPDPRSDSAIRPSARAALAAALACVAAAWLYSCRSTERFERRTASLVSAEPLPVTLSNEIRRLHEKDRAFVKKTTFRIGQLFEQLFRGKDGVAFLSAVSSDLETEWTPETRWKSTYSVSLVLQHEGTVHDVSAAGTGTSSDPERAGRRAIEACITDIYAQVEAILAGKPDPRAQAGSQP